MAENFVFLYIGVSIFTYEETKWDVWFILAAFVSFKIVTVISLIRAN